MRVQDHAVERFAEALLDLGCHLPKDLFLRFEVVVEGAVREAGSLRNVGDPGVQEAVLLEDLLRRREEARPCLDTLAGPGPAGLLAASVGVDTAFSFLRDPVTVASIYRRSRRKRTTRSAVTAQASFRWSRRTPDGVPPPEVTTAVLASAT